MTAFKPHLQTIIYIQYRQIVNERVTVYLKQEFPTYLHWCHPKDIDVTKINAEEKNEGEKVRKGGLEETGW